MVDSLMPGQRQLCAKNGVLPISSSSSDDPIISSSSSSASQEEPPVEKESTLWWYIKITGIGIIIIVMLGAIFTLIIRKKSSTKKDLRHFSSLDNKDTAESHDGSPSDESRSRIKIDADPESNFDRELNEVSIDISVGSEDRSHHL